MTRNITTKEFFRTLNLIYFSLVFTMVSFGVVAYFMGGQNGLDEELSTLFKYVLFVLAPAGLGAGYFIFKNVISSTGQQAALRDKLVKYQTAILIRSACLEFPGIVSGVGAFITGDAALLIFMAAVVVIFIFLRPTSQALVNDLSLSGEDRSLVENPEGVLYQSDR